MDGVELPLRSRRSTYFLLIGVVIGMLAAGLVVPLVFGDRSSDNALPEETAGLDELDDGDSGQERAAGTPAGSDTPAGSPGGTGSAPDPGQPAGEPSGDGPAAPNTPTATTPPAGGPVSRLTASDRGVTEKTIKIGAMLLEIGSLSTVGVNIPTVSPEQQREAWQIYIDALNAKGGINGRKVVPVYKQYDVLTEDTMREACLYVTRDQKVFAALDAGGIFGPPMLCFTQEHRTPLIMLGSQGIPYGYIERSGGYLFSMFESGVRTMANLVNELHTRRLLRGKKVGILEDNRGDPGGHTVARGAVKTMESLGYKVTYRARLSADTDTAVGQVPIEVQQMRTRGVDTVFLFTGTLNSTTFVQEADSQQYRLKYYVADWASMYSDIAAQNMPRNFEGSLALTSTRNNEWRVNRPEPAYDVECRKRWERVKGEKLDRTVTAYQVTLRICSLLDMFVKASSQVGATLTRNGLSTAMQRLGTVPMATFGGGAFAPRKFDAADYFRFMTWKFACRCWTPGGEFKRGRY